MKEIMSVKSYLISRSVNSSCLLDCVTLIAPNPFNFISYKFRNENLSLTRQKQLYQSYHNIAISYEK